jgi:hypothetical protein
LLAKHLFDLKILLFIGVELIKCIILVVTIFRSIASCAVFNRYVLLVGGAFNFAQVAALSMNKLFKVPVMLTYYYSDNDLGEVVMLFLRVIAGVLLVLSEVVFIIAIFWYMDTLDDMISGITSGLTLMVVANLDTAIYSVIAIDLVVHKTRPSELKGWEMWLEYGQIVFTVGMYFILMIIAAAVAYSDHDDYDSTNCN